MGKENLKAQEIPCSRIHQPHPCSACPNSPQRGAPGCGSGSGPEAAGTLAAAAAAAFPSLCSQSISVQCRLPPPRQAQEEGGPRIGCVLPHRPGPASPSRAPLQHRGQRPARALGAQPSREDLRALLRQSVRQPERGRGAARCVLIPPASFPPAQGSCLCPPGMCSKRTGCCKRPPASPWRTRHSPVSRSRVSALLPPSWQDKDELSVAGHWCTTAQPLKIRKHGSKPDPALRNSAITAQSRPKKVGPSPGPA